MNQNKILTRYDIRAKKWFVLGQINKNGEYVRDYTNEESNIMIPYCFRTDLASIPRVLWTYLSPYELSEEAPVVHDFLYRNAGRLLGFKSTRKYADDIFLQIMKNQNVGKIKRTVAYYAVRIFGFIVWKRHLRKNNASID